VEVNARDNSQATPLHHAISRKHNLHLIQFLLDNGADVKLLDRCKWTPLHLLHQMYPDPDIIDLLKKHCEKKESEWYKQVDLKRPRDFNYNVDKMIVNGLNKQQRDEVLDGDVSVDGILKARDLVFFLVLINFFRG